MAFATPPIEHLDLPRRDALVIVQNGRKECDLATINSLRTIGQKLMGRRRPRNLRQEIVSDNRSAQN